MRKLIVLMVLLSVNKSNALTKAECKEVLKLTVVTSTLVGYAFGRSMTDAGLDNKQKQDVLNTYIKAENGYTYLKQSPKMKEFEKALKDLGCI